MYGKQVVADIVIYGGGGLALTIILVTVVLMIIDCVRAVDDHSDWWK